MEKEIEHKHIFNYEVDRQSRNRALIILGCSIIVFLLAALGLFDWLSHLVSFTLLENLGYTNKWSTYFGPEWFIGINNDISALGGFPLLLIFLIIITIYYSFSKEALSMWRLLSIMVGAGALMLISKTTFAKEIPDDPIEILINSISAFPSGHAMMGTVFYITLGVTISRRQHSIRTKRLTILSAISIAIIIGISRILPGFHSVSEVLAGWSLGMIWLCLCWILESKIKQNISSKSEFKPTS